MTARDADILAAWRSAYEMWERGELPSPSATDLVMIASTIDDRIPWPGITLGGTALADRLFEAMCAGADLPELIPIIDEEIR